MKISSKKLENSIYLDHAAATPIDQRVAKEMALFAIFANGSAIHTRGVAVRARIEDARARIARTLHAHSDEIIFTGSGTESDALAIIGAVRAYKKIVPGKNKPHIITTVIEHPAILENCKILERNGEVLVTYMPVDARGIVDPKEIKKALQENTILVSVMYANNEIGTIQSIMEIAKILRHFRKNKNTLLPLFHTDACQAMNYLPTENIEKLGVDLLTWNSSKMYGPKGVGILYKKRGVILEPLYHGGGQEFGMRPGTENGTGIIGAAWALEKVGMIKEKEGARLTILRDYGIKKLLALSGIYGYTIVLNGDPIHRLPNNINISISDISSELLVIELDSRGIMVSAKSACKSDEPDDSYVITALRRAQEIEHTPTEGSLRISLGRETTKHDIDTLVNALEDILQKYKQWKEA